MFQSDIDARVHEGYGIFDEDLMEADCDPADGEEEVEEARKLTAKRKFCC
jgi:hypothetical protein